MTEVKFSLKCIEWHVFNFSTSVDLATRRAITAQTRANVIASITGQPNGGSTSPIKVINETQKSNGVRMIEKLRDAATHFEGDWALSDNYYHVRIHIREKKDAMLFKLSYANEITRMVFDRS